MAFRSAPAKTVLHNHERPKNAQLPQPRADRSTPEPLLKFAPLEACEEQTRAPEPYKRTVHTSGRGRHSLKSELPSHGRDFRMKDGGHQMCLEMFYPVNDGRSSDTFPQALFTFHDFSRRTPHNRHSTASGGGQPRSCGCIHQSAGNHSKPPRSTVFADCHLP